MSKMYSKSGRGNEKFLYDSSGRCIARGVTDKSGKTIYSGAGGYVGKSFETGHGTVKHYDSDNRYVGTGISRSGISTIDCGSSTTAERHSTGPAAVYESDRANEHGPGTQKRSLSSFVFEGETRKLPAYVTLSAEGKTRLYTSIPYAIIEESRENEKGRIIYKYRAFNSMGGWYFHETVRSPDELIEEFGIDYNKADVADFFKMPQKEREFHLTMYDGVINNRTPEYYYKKLRKERFENALIIMSLCVLGLTVLFALFT